MINNKLYKSLDFGAPYFQKKMTQIGSASIVMGFRCLDTGAGGEPNVGCKAQGWSGPAVQQILSQRHAAYPKGIFSSEGTRSPNGASGLLAFLSGCHGVSTCVSLTAMLRLLLRP